jgi:hypothetical protein
VDTTLTPAQAVEDIFLSNGIFISNITFNGQPATSLNPSVGIFSSNGSGLGIESGLILSTGTAVGAEGLWNMGNSANSLTGGISNDADIALLVDGASFDGAILEFDFIATGDSMDFVYVFGSEEYEEFVGSAFNDVFGFFVSGPGISGSFTNGAVNIALIPGTTDPVAINTVNSDLNAQYFVVNNGQIAAQYDGFTTPLHACIGGLQIGEAYHIKLAIADMADQVLDSGVFLSGNSFVQACTDGSREGECLLCEIMGHVTYTEECGTLILSNTSQINLETTGCRYEIGSFYSTFTIGDIFVSNTPPVAPVIAQNGTTLNVVNPENEVSYQWYLNGSPIDGATSASFDATESGAYQVTAINGCLSASNIFNAIISGIADHSQNALSVFPNPADRSFIVEFAAGTASFEIYDMTGKLIQNAITGGSNRMELSLSPGFYTLTTKNHQGFKNGIEKVVVR